MSHRRERHQRPMDTHKDRYDDHHSRSTGSYRKRHRSRSRSPVSGRGTQSKPHNRDRRRSPSPHKRWAQIPNKPYPRHEHSAAGDRDMEHSFPSRDRSKNEIGDKAGGDSDVKQTEEESSLLLKDKPSAPQAEAATDDMSKDDKDRLEEAIAAVKELASKQPSYTTARPMTEQQKMVQEKRKLLWSGKKNKPTQSRNQWESVSFGKDGEDSKFRRLMGIGSGKSATAGPSNEEQDEGSVQTSERTLTVLEQQYESSRYLTHIARGAGLGYGSQALTTELPSQKNSGDKLHETL